MEVLAMLVKPCKRLICIHVTVTEYTVEKLANPRSENAKSKFFSPNRRVIWLIRKYRHENFVQANAHNSICRRSGEEQVQTESETVSVAVAELQGGKAGFRHRRLRSKTDMLRNWRLKIYSRSPR